MAGSMGIKLLINHITTPKIISNAIRLRSADNILFLPIQALMFLIL